MLEITLITARCLGSRKTEFSHRPINATVPTIRLPSFNAPPRIPAAETLANLHISMHRTFFQTTTLLTIFQSEVSERFQIFSKRLEFYFESWDFFSNPETLFEILSFYLKSWVFI